MARPADREEILRNIVAKFCNYRGGLAASRPNVLGAVREAWDACLEHGARQCERIYAEHKKAKSYPANMGGLALECAAALRREKASNKCST